MIVASSAAYRLHEGDALRLLCAIDSASVDVVITDPPYCSGAMRMSDRFQPTKKNISTTARNTLPLILIATSATIAVFWRGPANGFRSVAALRGLGACF
nr:hypothetical protein [Xylella fastidiosa]